MSRQVVGRVLGFMLFAAGGLAAQAKPADTVNVTVGSTVVDFSSHQPGATRTVQDVTMGGNKRSMPPVIWSFRFEDAGGRKKLIVSVAPEDTTTRGPAMPVFVFDRKTLALLELRDRTTGAPTLTVKDTRITGTLNGPNGAMPVDMTLARPAFLGMLADLVAESLPRKLGVVYRVPLWMPGSPTVADHLYQFVRRESITVLGKTYPNAWVMEDRSADGATLHGTMWLVDGPPELVRWVINQPNGVINLDQAAAQRG